MFRYSGQSALATRVGVPMQGRVHAYSTRRFYSGKNSLPDTGSSAGKEASNKSAEMKAISQLTQVVPVGVTGPRRVTTALVKDTEAERVEAVAGLDDGQTSGELPELATLRDSASALLGNPAVAFIAVMSGDEIRLLSGAAADPKDPNAVSQIRNFAAPRDCSLCTHTLNEEKHLVIPDIAKFVLEDAKETYPAPFREVVAEVGGYPVPGVCPKTGEQTVVPVNFYAGANIFNSSGLAIGSFCTMFTKHQPNFGLRECKVLECLAAQAAVIIERQALVNPSSLRLLERRRGCPPGVACAVRPSDSTEKFTNRTTVDVVVLGGGPAGSAAACQLSFHGLSVVLVEPKTLFGAPTGVISKVMREVAIMKGSEATWEDVGRVRAIIATEDAARVRGNVERYGVRVECGTGKIKPAETSALDGPAVQTIEVTPTHVCTSEPAKPPVEIDTRALLIATGSKARRLGGLPEFDGKHVFDSDTINGVGRKPKSVLIQGAGIIGIEYATIFGKMGIPVIVTVSGDRSALLPMLDASLTEALVKDAEDLGVKFLFSTAVSSMTSFTGNVKAAAEEVGGDGTAIDILGGVELAEGGVKAVLKDKAAEKTTTYFLDVLLSCVGRVPLVENLGLETVCTGESGPSDIKAGKCPPALGDTHRLRDVAGENVYAIGDASGTSGLACMAGLHAQQAVDDLLPKLLQKGAVKKSLDLFPDPKNNVAASVVWTIPEIAFVGETEAAVTKRLGAEAIITAKASFADTTRGSVNHIPTSSFVKLICRRRDGVVLGAHLHGEGCAECVHYGASLVRSGTSVFDAQYVTFPAVTLHEVWRAAARAIIEELSSSSPSPNKEEEK